MYSTVAFGALLPSSGQQDQQLIVLNGRQAFEFKQNLVSEFSAAFNPVFMLHYSSEIILIY